MSDFPLFFRLPDRLCVVVGGGSVGMRKVRALWAAGARIRLVARDVADGERPPVELHLRAFRPEDLEGAALAFAATGDREVNRAVAREAKRRGIPVNVADRPEEGDFTLPAVLRRGDLAVAVGTGGQSPALASVVRDVLGGALGPEWETVLALAAALRRKKLTPGTEGIYTQGVLRRLVEGGLPAMIAAGDEAGADRLLKSLLGEGFSLTALGVHLPKGT